MAGVRLGFQVYDGVREILTGLPKYTYTFVRQEVGRHVTRFRRRMVSERMSGRPGIDGGKFRDKKNRNLRVWVKGRTLGNLEAGATISRILRVHEEGATISGSPWLYLRTGPKGSKVVVGRVRSVTIPARLGFRGLWDSMRPDSERRVLSAMARAAQVAQQRRRIKVIDAIASVAG